MRKKIVGIFICTLLIITIVPSINGRAFESQKKDTLTNGKGTPILAFIIGPIESISWDEGFLVLTGGWNNNHCLRFKTLRFQTLVIQHAQIKLVKYNYCIIKNNFIIGICKIYVPWSEISMHIFSQNDTENKITWVVDEITGDKIYKQNLYVRLYNESGDYYDYFKFEPSSGEYLSIGDQLIVSTYRDGYYRLIITECIFFNAFFNSGLVKY